MADPTAAEIIDIVKTLKEDKEGRDLRRDIKRRLEQHAMTDVPWVPDYLQASGRTVVMNSPRIAELARQINAVMSGYTTTVTAVPGEPGLQDKADKAEKAYALKRAELFTPQVVMRARWRQMVVAYDFYKLWCGDVDSPNAWRVIQPDPQQTYFMLGDEVWETMRPSLVGREYRQSIRTMRNFYNRREGKLPTWDGSIWNWQKVSDEKDANGGMPSIVGASAGNSKAQWEEILLYEYDNGETTYVVGVNRNSNRKNAAYTDKGEILWSQPNITGGSSYVMVPGYMTGSTELREKILPHLWGPMNVQFQIDLINTLRASRSMNMKPQVLVQRDPQLLQAAAQLGIISPVPNGYEALGSDTIIDIDGRPHFWVLPSDEDLAKLEESKQRELENYISTELALTQAEIIKDAAVRNIQLALGVRAQQQGLMLTFEAIGERELLKMWAHSIEAEGGYPDARTLFAKQRIIHGNGIVKPGEKIIIQKGDFNFDHHVEVATASMSEQERQFLVQAALERKISRISTWPEVLDQAGYQNRQEQELALVEEEGYEGASAFYGPWLEPVFRQRLAEREGILIPAAMLGQGGAGGSGAGVDNAPNEFPLPETEVIRGESGGMNGGQPS